MLQQRIHRHHQEAAEGAEHDQKWHRNPQLGDEVHAQHQQPHRDAQGNHPRRLVEPHAQRRHHRTGCGADGHHADQRRRLRGLVAQRHRCPGQHDVAQIARNAPEQGGGGQRDLAQLVRPQPRVAALEIAHQAEQAVGDRLQRRFRARDAQVEGSGQCIQGDHRRDGRFGRCINSGVDPRQIEGQQVAGDAVADQLPAEQDAEDDRQDGQTLDPAIGLDQLRVGQQLGQDAVLGRRVSGGAKPDDGIGHQRVAAEQHHQAADDLDQVREEHHPALGQRIGNRADERGQDHIEQREHGHQCGGLPCGLPRAFQQLHPRHEQRVVSQRAEKLRRHDGVKTFFHSLVALSFRVGMMTKPCIRRVSLRRGL